MWDTIDFIVKYLIERGGVWGLLLVLSLTWIYIRETKLYKNKETLLSEPKEFDKSILMLKEQQEAQLKILTECTKDVCIILKKIQDISSSLDNFNKVNIASSKKIEKLDERLQQINDERVDELKELLLNYNKTMNELALTLQNIKFVLKTRLGED